MHIRSEVKRFNVDPSKTMATKLLPSIVIGLVVLLSASSQVRAEPASYPYKVTATVGMVADIVQEVAGDRAEVAAIIGEGVDPHLYRPTIGAVKMLRSADVVFYCGLLLEGKMGDTLVKLARTRPVYAVTELIDPEYLLTPPGMQGHYDPHVWMDASAWARAVQAVAESLGEFDPANREHYLARAQAYRSRVLELHEYARNAVATIPESRRVLVTAHDAFNYFGRAYGLEVRGIQGLSTESEAGLRDINALVDLIVDRGITAVFVETSVPDKNVRALIEGAAARGATVRIGGKLFSDAMGAPGTYRGTYIGMIDHNVTTIARALGGDAPAGGMRGLLAGDDPEH